MVLQLVCSMLLLMVMTGLQARCRGELFIECSRLDDKVPISHEEQMSTLRKVRLPRLLLCSCIKMRVLHTLWLQAWRGGDKCSATCHLSKMCLVLVWVTCCAMLQEVRLLLV